MIEPFKWLLQPVAIERDASGQILREISGETLSVYSTEQLLLAVRMFESKLVELNGDTRATTAEIEPENA